MQDSSVDFPGVVTVGFQWCLICSTRVWRVHRDRSLTALWLSLLRCWKGITLQHSTNRLQTRCPTIQVPRLYLYFTLRRTVHREHLKIHGWVQKLFGVGQPPTMSAGSVVLWAATTPGPRPRQVIREHRPLGESRPSRGPGTAGPPIIMSNTVVASCTLTRGLLVEESFGVRQRSVGARARGGARYITDRGRKSRWCVVLCGRVVAAWCSRHATATAQHMAASIASTFSSRTLRLTVLAGDRQKKRLG